MTKILWSFAPPFEKAVEELGVDQHPPEDRPLERVQAHVPCDDGPGLDEHFENLDAARAVDRAGAAQEAAHEALVHSPGVLENLLDEPVEEGQLAAGHIGFSPCFGKKGADGLAHPAAHADDELLFEVLDESRQFLHVVHGASPMILPALRMPFGSRAHLIRRE